MSPRDRTNKHQRRTMLNKETYMHQGINNKQDVILYTKREKKKKKKEKRAIHSPPDS